MADTTLGRDLPGGDPLPDLPVRPADLGWGIGADDVARGYRSTEPDVAGDDRAGEVALPTPKGFLYRGSLGLDR